MAKRTLRSLLRETPNADELGQFLDLLVDESSPPSLVAILGIALVDNALREAIAKKMPNANACEALFSDNGPLHAFASKIKVAHALGLLNDDLTHDLNRLRDIRNAFAHALLPLNFEHPDVLREIEKLRLFERDPEASAQRHFGASVALAIAVLGLVHIDFEAIGKTIGSFLSSLRAAMR